MNTAEQILVIFLSTFLAIFLALAIILVSKVSKLVDKMDAVADTAQEVVTKANDIAGNVEEVSDMFKRSAGPLALGKYFLNIAEMVTKRKKGDK